MKTLRIGMAGLDTSHVPAFAKLLHDKTEQFHVPGGKIVAAFPGGSSDFDLSINRVEGFATDLRDKHGVEIVGSLAGLRDKCDAIMLESIDGRVHLEQFREVAPWGIPVFIDKPLSVSAADASEIVRLAKSTNTRVTSASAVRFAEQFRAALVENCDDPIIGGDFYGPMAFLEKCPGYFWYGIHSAEMLFATMGTGCQEVLAIQNESHDVIIGRWADNRVGVLRGNRDGNNSFGGTIHRKARSKSFDVGAGNKPFYASLLEKVIPFFQGKAAVVELDEMLEVIRFLEAAGKSASKGTWQSLSVVQ